MCCLWETLRRTYGLNWPPFWYLVLYFFILQYIRSFKKYKWAQKRIKHLGLNWTKEVKDLYTENCKTLLKEIKDKNKWKDIPCSWIGRLNIKIILLKVIYRFTCNLYQNPNNNFFCKNRKIHTEIHKESQGTPKARTILKKNKAGELRLRISNLSKV